MTIPKVRCGMREKLTKSKDRVKKHGEVYTPDHIVRQMCDMLERESPGAFGIHRMFLEPACGNGNFLAEIFRRKIMNCKGVEDGLSALGSIYAIDILPDNVMESKARLLAMFQMEYGFLDLDKAKQILDSRIMCGDALKVLEELETKEWNEVWRKEVRHNLEGLKY